MIRTLSLLGLIMITGSPRSAAMADEQAGPLIERPAAAEVSVHARINLALAAGDAQGALSLLKNRALHISRAERRSIEGRAQLLLGNVALARRKLKTALRLRPEDATDWYWLGRVHQSGGTAALAASSFEKAHWHGLESVDLFHHCAEALRDSDKILGEITQHQGPGATAPAPSAGSFAFDGLVIGPVRSRPGWWIVAPPDSALYQVHKALALKPARGESLLLCGELWAAANRDDLAITRFDQASKTLRGDGLTRCHGHWAQSLMRLSDLEGYLQHTKTQMRLIGRTDPTELAECYDRAAREAGGLGDSQSQLRYLQAAAELKPRVVRLLRLADALIQARRWTEATPFLKMALTLNPTKMERRRIKQRLQGARLLASPEKQR